MSSDYIPDEYAGATDEHEAIRHRLIMHIRSLNDDEFFTIWQRVLAEHFCPDREFEQFNLEGKLSRDEFMDVLLEEVDKRSREQNLQQDPAMIYL